MTASNASSDVPPSSDQLERIAAGATGKPEPRKQTDMGHYGIRISSDGTWYHLGTPIKRLPLVKLFATVLHRDEDGGYSLRTPVERGRITVDDAPFTIVEAWYDDDGSPEMTSPRLMLRTNLDRIVAAGPEHRIRVETCPETGEPRPYIDTGNGLDALIVRSVFYDLVNQAVTLERDGDTILGLWSGGVFHELGSI
ncbi:DUF1285 domain-containing protein [Nisaea acidiphila]|uniref:DUF1285 domain-containing protein n=1 Tax=Nisaea acidiphila TaxID=1862145 RepID=A0A9J7AM28_9PROT|nr:DUF1285 domain-containing protein [Nisaea acidiphila]UUX48528.1 DUF1285 domain-containing protein [Nisaea acidiphila]